MQRLENIWVRIAVVKKHDTTLENPPLWRFFLHREDPDLHLVDWTMQGEAIPGVNYIPYATPKPDKDSAGMAGLKAAIDVFGNIEIGDDKTARITLKNPAA